VFRWFRFRKRIRQLLRFRVGEEKTVLFIVGCQRSGTSMIHPLFRLDWDTVTYDEVSPLSDQDHFEGYRLNPMPEIMERIAGDRSPLVVCKPLVESQNLDTLLALFPRSRAIWMYRDYRDVVASSLKYFGTDNGHSDVTPIILGDFGNWRAEHLDEADVRRIREVYKPDLDPQDAAALFWYARNSLYFSRRFLGDPRVRTCRYGDLVSNPAETMKAAYEFLGRPYPGDRIVVDVFSASQGRGKAVGLSPPIEGMCEGLLDRLDREAGLWSRTGRPFPPADGS
jgi:hypothetical protein